MGKQSGGCASMMIFLESRCSAFATAEGAALWERQLLTLTLVFCFTLWMLQANTIGHDMRLCWCLKYERNGERKVCLLFFRGMDAINCYKIKFQNQENKTRHSRRYWISTSCIILWLTHWLRDDPPHFCGSSDGTGWGAEALSDRNELTVQTAEVLRAGCCPHVSQENNICLWLTNLSKVYFSLKTRRTLAKLLANPGHQMVNDDIEEMSVPLMQTQCKAIRNIACRSRQLFWP